MYLKNKNYSERFSNGYVDHGYNTKEFVDAMLEDPDAFVRYLFNDGSFVKTGNDNSEMEWYYELENIDYPHDMFVKDN